MASSTFQSTLFVSLIVLSAGLKTESSLEMRNDIMMDTSLELKTGPKSLGSKVKDNFHSLEVAIAVQIATQQRFTGFVQGGLLLVVLAALGLYAINDQSGKSGKKSSAMDADVKTSPAPAPVSTPDEIEESVDEIEEDLDMYCERQQAEEDCDDDSAFLKEELTKMLDASLEAEAEAACVVKHAEEEVPALSRAEIEAREMIEQELDRYLDAQHASKDLEADWSVLKTELTKMLDDSLEAEAQAAMVIHPVEEEVDVSRMEMEIEEQLSEALGLSLIPLE